MAMTHLVRPSSPAQLVTAYRPSEPHGWPAGAGQELGVTIGRQPNRGHATPAIGDDLYWIQVVRSVGPPLEQRRVGQPLLPRRGLTSIHGTTICNFYDHPGMQGLGPPPGEPPPGGPPPADPLFIAEAFPARDSGLKESGREVITTSGASNGGWHVEVLPAS